MRIVMTLAPALAVVACSGGQHVPAAAGPAGGSMAVVTGTVFYLERIALPPGAVLVVQLSDVSLADAPADVIASDTITVTTQVPIPFSLSYDPKHIIAVHTYVVQARIEVDGKLRFISTSANPVITRGKPSTVDVRVSPAQQ